MSDSGWTRRLTSILTGSASKRDYKHDLWQAIVNNDMQKVAEFVKVGADLNEYLSPFTNNRNSLHVALLCGHVEMVHSLLAAGANPLIPIQFGGYEFKCSEAAEARGFRGLSDILKRAETEAERLRGVRPPLQRLSNLCKPDNIGRFLR